MLYYRDGNHDEPETSDCKPRERPTIDGALIEELKPVGELEAVLADRIVSLAWRLRRAAHVEAELFRRKHHDRFVTAAMNRANSCGRSEMQDLLDQLDGTVRDEEAHDQALREAEEARALRDAEPNAVAAAFEWDSSDIFSKLARYETSIERSLYKAIYEVERLQAARSGSSIGAAVGDLNVDTGQAVS